MPPQEALSTRTLTPASLAWMANSMAAMAPLMDPKPVLSMNFRLMMLAFQLTPTTPVPVAAAPMMPDTWVPWL